MAQVRQQIEPPNSKSTPPTLRTATMQQRCRSGGRLLPALAAAAAAALLVHGLVEPCFATGRALGGHRLRPAGPGPHVQLRAAKEAEVVGEGFKIEETDDNAKIGAGFVSFVAGLLFPLLGSFNFGLILGSLGYALACGTASEFLAKQEQTKEYVKTADQAGELLAKAGSSAVKVVNWGAAKVKELQ
uniref:Uncharacterized protein n=1 Tax=Alexandrium catenella TaxID=2925 RepID=A0A7S1S6R2_ALECA